MLFYPKEASAQAPPLYAGRSDSSFPKLRVLETNKQIPILSLTDSLTVFSVKFKGI